MIMSTQGDAVLLSPLCSALGWCVAALSGLVVDDLAHPRRARSFQVRRASDRRSLGEDLFSDQVRSYLHGSIPWAETMCAERENCVLCIQHHERRRRSASKRVAPNEPTASQSKGRNRDTTGIASRGVAFEGGGAAHVLQNVRDTKLFVVVSGQLRGSAFEEPRRRLANRTVKEAPNSRPPG